MKANTLGKEYQDGDVIVRQGESGEQIYVVQEGQVEVVKERDGVNYQISVLGKGEFFGEMAVFERTERVATVRALELARVLTIDKADFLRRVKEDPSLAFHLVETMSARIRKLDEDLVQLKNLLWDKGIPADINSARVKDLFEKDKP